MDTEEIFRFPVRLSVKTPVDLIAAVPYLVGFHPENCVIALGTDGHEGSVDFASGCGPLTGAVDDPSGLAGRLCVPFTTRSCRSAILIAYGADELVTPCLLAARTRLRSLGVTVAEALRVTKDRYWSYECAGTDRCDPEGVPYDIHHSTIPATAVAAGVRVRADRAEILSLTDPVTGAERETMDRATRDAEQRCARLWGESGPTGRASLTAEGIRTVRTVVAAALNGEPPPAPATVAWLGVLLVDLRTRDEAWAHIDRSRIAAHISLWSHVLRRVDTAYAAAPASLLAFAAWQNDDPVLADAALDRAVAAEPDYSMAGLVRRAVHSGLSPRDWDGFTPEWLAEQAPVADGTEAG